MRVESVAASAYRLEVLLREQFRRIRILKRLERMFGETDSAMELRLDIVMRPGDLARVAHTIQAIEEFLQDGPPQHKEMEYIHLSYDLLFGEEVLEPDLRNGGSFIICPFGELCLGNGAPEDVADRWHHLTQEMINEEARLRL